MLLGETDTTVAVDALFHRGLRQKSGVERLRMACDMFDVATALIVASLRPEVAGRSDRASNCRAPAEVLAGAQRTADQVDDCGAASRV